MKSSTCAGMRSLTTKLMSALAIERMRMIAPARIIDALATRGRSFFRPRSLWMKTSSTMV